MIMAFPAVKWYVNPWRSDALPPDSPPHDSGAREFHTKLPGYVPTPLVEQPALARELGIGRLLIKDESARFGLKAFKGLGASYAGFRLLQEKIFSKSGTRPGAEDLLGGAAARILGDITLATATDGNHGRAVAWAARIFDCAAEIYIPTHAAKARIEAIESEGARVIVVDGSYDEAVELCDREAQERDMLLVQDSAWAGYEEIPRWIMEGYLTMFAETDEQMASLPGSPAPDVVFAQAGVGSFAGAAAWHYAGDPNRRRPRMVCVEPDGAACLFASITSAGGGLARLEGELHTLMACLNAGTPSSLAWPVNRATYDVFLAVDDGWAAEAMRRYNRPRGGDVSLVSGEAGSAGMAGLLAMASTLSAAEAREAAGLGPESTVLVFITEGDTDPETFAAIVASE